MPDVLTSLVQKHISDCHAHNISSCLVKEEQTHQVRGVCHHYLEVPPLLLRQSDRFIVVVECELGFERAEAVVKFEEVDVGLWKRCLQGQPPKI